MTALTFEAFVDLSAALTGFARFDLQATTMADFYLATIEASVPTATLASIATTWEEIAAGEVGAREAQVNERLMGSEKLGSDARRILMLWYTGSWYRNPPFDASTLSPQSYVQGLMWKAIGSHPMAAQPQGYGAWAQQPPQRGA